MKPALLLLSALFFASCTTKAPEATAATTSVATAKKGAKKAPKPKPYPIQTCLVTGDGLDDMDERVTTVYEGQTFEFCCKPCLKKFNKNPAKYVKALAKSTG
jgi:YHS domain-containing protein